MAQLRWMTKSLKAPTSPIHQWPNSLVEKALRNMATDAALAKEEFAWPILLTEKYYHKWLLETLEKIWNFDQSAFLMLGKPKQANRRSVAVCLWLRCVTTNIVSKHEVLRVSIAPLKLISYADSLASSTWPAPKRGKTRALKKPFTIMKRNPPSKSRMSGMGSPPKGAEKKGKSGGAPSKCFSTRARLHSSSCS